jgi:hypothetical protein
MTSAVASNLPAAAVPYGWLSPRVSLSRDEPSPPVLLTTATPEPAISKDFIDFQFCLGDDSATMLPADELFADGKLLPLRKAAAAPLPEAPAPAPAPEAAIMPAPAEPTKPLRAADAYAFSPKAPSCSSRWRELLGLKRAAAHQSPNKPSPSATATSSAAARSLKLLLQRNTAGGRSSASSDLSSAPLLLRDGSDSAEAASSRFSLSSSSSSSNHDHDDAPRLSLDSAADPPRVRLVRSAQHRHSTSSSSRRPPPSADSPRMNSSGKIVFQGLLERSYSSPCRSHAASKSHHHRAVDRSYSSGGVRVAPVVLNMPVCSRPVFGFFKDKKDSAASNAAAARSRSSRGRKAPPQGWSGELPRSSGA